MGWSLYKENNFLKPLTFSNKKTQEDVVNEVLKAINEGTKVIFIHGVCGTGKSAIALNIAKKVGKTAIVVPGKTLQEQYKSDYESKKYLKKENGEKLKISVMTGRQNHECPFLKENKIITREKNSSLNEIFSFDKDKKISEDISADNKMLPCKIELKEKNFWKIKEYLRQNNKINNKEINEIKDVTRASVASICPYWSPVLPEKYDLKNFEDSKKKKYEGLDGNHFMVYKGKPGCKYYEQFSSFVDSDVIVFNSLKYKLETILNRKPLTEVEIIDEGDEFLDSFSNQQTLNLGKLQFSLAQIISEEEEVMQRIIELQKIISHIKNDERINDAAVSNAIIPLKHTGVYDILKIILNFEEIFALADDESYLFDAEEIARSFSSFMQDTYLTVTKKENTLYFHLVTTNLKEKFNELLKKNKTVILMSGTLHSESILKNVFGIENYKRIEAEIEQQGSIVIKRTQKEIDCKYSNFSSGKFTRKDYLLSLEECIKISKKPVLVHVNAFSDLPTEKEKEYYSLEHIISREELQAEQSIDKMGERVKEFKKGGTDILFSTRVSRGIDFPGGECNSIVFTKYPNPNVEDAFWKILMKTKPQFYWDFYKDKARREILQKVYRGLRFKEDKVEVLSPDLRVIEFFEK